jgi:hypothetical protein
MRLRKVQQNPLIQKLVIHPYLTKMGIAGYGLGALSFEAKMLQGYGESVRAA